MPGPIRFYLDFISPYAYLAWTQIHALAARHQRAVEPIPVLFAGLLDHFGQLGPAEIPAKRAYVFKNVFRLAHGLGVPLAPPPAHPFNPLLALRIASLTELAGDRVEVVSALYRATWGGGGGVTSAEVVADLLGQRGHDGARICAAAGEVSAKERVRAQTSEAIAVGVFGVPTMVADGELFWGLDSLPHLDQFLAGNDPVPAGMSEVLDRLPAGARRRRVR